MRKSLQERIDETLQAYVKDVLAFEANVDQVDRNPGDYRRHTDKLKEALQALRLRKKDVTYRMCQADSLVERERCLARRR